MKILVIGGNGFIGRQLCLRLLQHKEEVFSFDCKEPERSIPEITYITGNFFDLNCLENSLEDMDVVVHAVSTITPNNSNERYMQGYEGDLMQTIRLCDLACKKNIKMIFLSSGGTVYGEQERQPITEEACTGPINHYGNIKLCIENVIRIFNRQNGGRQYIARISNPYGEGQDYRKGVGFIDAVIRRTINEETVEIWGDGSIVRDYIYITDVCEMIYRLCLYEGPDIVFNLSSGMGASQNEIIELVKKELGGVKVKYLAKRNIDVQKVILDNTKIMRLYERPCMRIDEGIKKYIAYLKSMQ